MKFRNQKVSPIEKELYKIEQEELNGFTINFS